jgi:hypothetical protein
VDPVAVPVRDASAREVTAEDRQEDEATEEALMKIPASLTCEYCGRDRLDTTLRHKGDDLLDGDVIRCFELRKRPSGKGIIAVKLPKAKR